MNSLIKNVIKCSCVLVVCASFMQMNVTDLRLTEFAVNAADDSEAATEDTTPKATFTNTSVEVGKPITATLENVTSTNISYSWTLGGSKIDNSTNTYTPTSDDMEKMLTVTITADNVKYTSSIYLSTLPVVYVNTENNQEITSKETYIGGTCKVQGNDEFSDSSVLYDGAMEIRGRGNYTWEHEKKPYKIKLDSKADLLGMGKNKHWCLIAEYVDPTHLRNSIFPEISKTLGMEYTAEAQPVVLILNGSYNGMYHLSENVRLGSERIDIYDWENTAEDIAKAVYKANKADGMTKDMRDELETSLQEDLTWVTSGTFTYNNVTYTVSDYVELPDGIDGGYLLELDTYDAYHTQAVSDFTTDGEQPVQFKSPEYANTNSTMYNYAKDYIQSYEDAVSSDDFYTTYDGKEVHYSQLFDMDSLVQYWMFLELSANSDGMRYSNYMYKDFDSLFKMGPAWDYDWTWNAGYTVPTNEWWTDQSYYNDTVHWYKYLVKDPYFLVKAYELYNSSKDELKEVYADNGMIDTLEEKYKSAATADLAKWYEGYDYESEVEETKTYVSSRFQWLDTQFETPETLISSLGYEASDELSISNVTASGSTVTATATVSNSSASSVTFHVNGILAGTGTIENGEAKISFSSSMLENDSDSLNVIEIRMLDSDGNYLKSTSSSNNNNNNWNFGGWGGNNNPWGQQTTTSSTSTVYSNYKIFSANDIGAETLTKVAGDVDCSNNVNVVDMSILKNYVLTEDSTLLTSQGLYNADMNSDNSVNISDVVSLKKYILKVK